MTGFIYIVIIGGLFAFVNGFIETFTRFSLYFNGTIFVSKDDKAVEGYGAVFHRILKRFNDFGTLENIDYDFKSKLFETFLKESIIAIQEINKGYQRQKTNQHSRKDESARKPEQYHAEAGVII